LPIALGILIASGQLKAENLDQYEFAGELMSNAAMTILEQMADARDSEFIRRSSGWQRAGIDRHSFVTGGL